MLCRKIHRIGQGFPSGELDPKDCIDPNDDAIRRMGFTSELAK